MRSVLCAAVILVAACTTDPAPMAPATSEQLVAQQQRSTVIARDNLRLPFELIRFNPCITPGELVQLSGALHIMSFQRENANGKQQWTFHAHPVGVRGTGVSSGREYRLTGSESTQTFETPDGDVRFQQVGRLRLIATGGGGDNFHLSILVHYEIVNGVLDVTLSKIDVACR